MNDLAPVSGVPVIAGGLAPAVRNEIESRGYRVIRGFRGPKGFTFGEPAVCEVRGGVYRFAVYLERAGMLSCRWVYVSARGVEVGDGTELGPLARYAYREI